MCITKNFTIIFIIKLMELSLKNWNLTFYSKWYCSDEAGRYKSNVHLTSSHQLSTIPINHAQYDACTLPQPSNAIWNHSSGNSLSVSMWHSHLGKLGSKCRGHPVVHKQLPLPPWWLAWVTREFQTKWHAPKYKYFPSRKFASTYWQSLHYFHAVWSMTHELH